MKLVCGMFYCKNNAYKIRDGFTFCKDCFKKHYEEGETYADIVNRLRHKKNIEPDSWYKSNNIKAR